MQKQKLKKVLSIDLDYLVGDDLQLYNDICGDYGLRGNPESETYWITGPHSIERERHVDKHIAIDKHNEKFLDALIKKVIASVPAENIFFSVEHDGFLEFLCGDPNKFEEKLELWNIDHHTDIFYGQEQRDRAELYQVATIGSWVHYLGVNEKLYKYNFIGNEFSVRNGAEEKSSLNYPIDLNKTQDDIKDVKFDYILICKSPGFLPFKMQYKFDEYLRFAEEEKKCTFNVCCEPYNPGGRSRMIAR